MKRRNFIKKTALTSLAAIAGTEVVFGHLMPAEYTPLALQDPDPYKLFNKDKEMVLLNDKPWNMEAQAHMLDEKITTNPYIFIRNNGKVPEKIDVANWTLTFDGESVKQKKTYSLEDLKTKFEHHTYQLTLECGGNGRSEFDPPAKGNQWTVGAVYAAEWTGVRLKDVLKDVGIKSNAVYIGFHAADQIGFDMVHIDFKLVKAKVFGDLAHWATDGIEFKPANQHFAGVFLEINTLVKIA